MKGPCILVSRILTRRVNCLALYHIAFQLNTPTAPSRFPRRSRLRLGAPSVTSLPASRSSSLRSLLAGMFDVDWADYDCEPVGRRRAQLGIERHVEGKGASDGVQEAPCPTRHLHSKEENLFRFFGGTGLKRGIAHFKSIKQGVAISQSSKRPNNIEQRYTFESQTATDVSTSTEYKSLGFLSLDVRDGTDDVDLGWGESANRSSEGSLFACQSHTAAYYLQS